MFFPLPSSLTFRSQDSINAAKPTCGLVAPQRANPSKGAPHPESRNSRTVAEPFFSPILLQTSGCDVAGISGQDTPTHILHQSCAFHSLQLRQSFRLRPQNTPAMSNQGVAAVLPAQGQNGQGQRQQQSGGVSLIRPSAAISIFPHAG